MTEREPNSFVYTAGAFLIVIGILTAPLHTIGIGLAILACFWVWGTIKLIALLVIVPFVWAGQSLRRWSAKLIGDRLESGIQSRG